MAKSNASKAKDARSELEEALAEFAPFAEKVGALPSRIENYLADLLAQADAYAARVREEESRGRREAERFATQIGEILSDGADEMEAELESERGMREAAERMAQASEKTLADLQAKIPGVTLTGQAPAALAIPAGEVQPVAAALAYEGRIMRASDYTMRAIKLTPKGDSAARSYTVGIHRDHLGDMLGFTLSPEAAH